MPKEQPAHVRQTPPRHGPASPSLHHRRRGASVDRPSGEHHPVLPHRSVPPKLACRRSRRARRPRPHRRCRGGHHRAHGVPIRRPDHGTESRDRRQADRSLRGLRQAREARAGLQRIGRHRRGRPGLRRGHRATRELLRLLPAPTVLRRRRAAHAVRLPRAREPSRRSRPARMRSVHPRFHHGGAEDRQADHEDLLGLLHRSRRAVPREHPGSDHPQDLPSRRAAPPHHERRGGKLPPRHHEPAQDAA